MIGYEPARFDSIESPAQSQKRFWLWGFALLALLVLIVGLLARSLTGFFSGVEVSRETTYLTEPLSDDGLPDYSGALLSQWREGVTSENNGAIPFLQAMWPAEHDPEQQTAICEELGMEAPQTDGMPDVDDDRKLLTSMASMLTGGEQGELDAEELLRVFRTRAWVAEEAPPLAEWFEEHRGSLKLIHKSVEKPCFYLPSPDLLTSPKKPWLSLMLPSVHAMRSASGNLALRANLLLGEGDAAAAWRDCRAIYRLAARVPRDILVSELVSVRIESRANQVALAILSDESLDAATTRAMLDFCKARGARSSMVDVLEEGERISFITSILAMAQVRPDPETRETDEDFPLPAVAIPAIDWNIVLRMGNQWQDKLIAAMRKPTWEERRKAIDQFEADLGNLDHPTMDIGQMLSVKFSRQARSRMVGQVTLSLALPAYSSTMNAEDRANAHRELLTVAAALAVHRVEHEEYPQTLDELVPELIGALPTDFYHGDPLVYRKTDRGYLLYTLGANGKDDQGSNVRARRYLGYDVSSMVDWVENAVRRELGEPELTPENEQSFEQPPDWLDDRIPDDADDHSIRLPLPHALPPNLE